MEEIKDKEQESNNFKKEIRKEAQGQFAKWVVATLGMLIIIAATGWFYYLKPYIMEVFHGVPSGGVVAFDDPKGCPKGWELVDFPGRVVIGVGQSNGLANHAYRKDGGKEEVQLVENQMPKHSHTFSGVGYTFGAMDMNQGYSSSIALGKNQLSSSYTPSGTISYAGNNAAHENMPPWIALYYCKRL